MSLANMSKEEFFKPLVINISDFSDRIVVRDFELNDITCLQKIDMNLFFVHLRHTFGGPMGFLNEAISHQNQKNRKDFFLAIVDKKTSKVIGSILIYNYNKKKHQVEIGYFIDKHRQNCKIATEACIYAMYYFGEFLNIKRFCATVHPENISSKKLLTKLGFVQKGNIFISNYKEDPDKENSYNNKGHLENAPRISLFVNYKDFLFKKNSILSDLKINSC